LLLAEWAWWGMLLALLGLFWLGAHQWRVAVLLGITWVGYLFYGLNYYVPDLNVFLLPAHLVTAVFLATGISAVVGWLPFTGEKQVAASLLPLLLLIPLAQEVVSTWPLVDQAQETAWAEWGTAVLNLPLDPNSLILADSEKIAPLYYLQKAEGMRPDLAIQVLPDEAAYRAALQAGLAQGQTVYLARYLPGLEGAYHLRAMGPLTEVGTSAWAGEIAPTALLPTPLDFGGVQLLGAEVQAEAEEQVGHTAVSLYWQATQPITSPLKIYLRWADGEPLDPTGRHAVHDYYPVLAWKNGEIVPDYQLIPHPTPRPDMAELQIALAPPFTPAAELVWQRVTAVDFSTVTHEPSYSQAVRQWFAPDVWLTSVGLPTQMRPLAEGQSLPVALAGQGVEALQVSGELLGDDGVMGVDVGLVSGEENTAVCGWSLNPFAPPVAHCPLGQIPLSGVPIPPQATNFGDQIALLTVEPTSTLLTPGGELSVTLTWQAVGAIPDDYTVFVQLLNPAGALVAQQDAWPLQGTYPTSAWRIGETIRDPYLLPLPPDLPPGAYQLIIGLYRLADLQRLPVLDSSGTPLDDKYSVPGLVVE
jgi:hypothetical protein